MTKRILLGVGLTLLLGACDDDEQSTASDAAAHDSSTPDGGAKDAAIDANIDAAVDASTDASFIPSDSGSADGGFCPSQFFPDGGAAYETYNVSLTTAAEQPACPGAGPAASGSASIVFSCTNPSFYVTNLTWQNLSSTVQAAHIHYGAVGAAGPVVINLEATNTGLGNGAGNASTFQAKPGGPPTFEAFLNELRAGKAYLNVHTETCPSGEIRGQIPPH
ncbi:MAG TPA: CHRD domain-containing protein [Polyangiales bacterium]